MNIGIICYPTYGGSGVIATELGQGLAEKGHQIHFITYSQPRRLNLFNPNLFYHEVSLKNYPLFEYAPYELALASKIVEVVKYEKLDLLHVHYAVPHASAAFMAKQILKSQGITIPFITTLHGTDITLVGKDPSYAPAVTFAINESDSVTAVSNDLKKSTEEHFDITNEIKVIPNFIDLSRFNRQKKEHFKLAICPNNERLLVHTSNFRKVKRVQDVIDIFCRVKKVVPAKLLLVGDGPERAMMENLSRETCGCEDVRFLGKMEQVEEVLSVADLFVMPSEKESFGLAALEAMACEVPVVSTNVGGIPELNIHGETGYLCDVGDTESMAKFAISILDERNLAKFKSNALSRAKEFQLDAILPRYEALYEEIVKKSKASLSL